MLAPYVFIVGVWRCRPEIIVGFSLVTGPAAAFIVRLVIGISHYGMGGYVAPSPDYFAFSVYTNLLLFFVSLGSWAWNHKEVNYRGIEQGFLLGIVSWIMLVGIAMTFF